MRILRQNNRPIVDRFLSQGKIVAAFQVITGEAQYILGFSFPLPLSFQNISISSSSYVYKYTKNIFYMFSLKSLSLNFPSSHFSKFPVNLSIFIPELTPSSISQQCLWILPSYYFIYFYLYIFAVLPFSLNCSLICGLSPTILSLMASIANNIV